MLRGAAFVTGAASGIGQATACSFARHGITKFALADRNLCDITISQLRKINPDVEIKSLQLDVSSESDVNSAITETARDFGRLDVAVNNAGIGGQLTKCENVVKENWDTVVSVNLTGVMLCQRAQLRVMMEQENISLRHGRGVIINIASMLGLIGTSTNVPSDAYTATKHAVVGLTKSTAIQYARDGVRINAMCPGYVETPLLTESTKNGIMKLEIEKTPMGRLAKMEEIADCVAFLASPLSSFMTGAALVADGGYTCQ